MRVSNYMIHASIWHLSYQLPFPACALEQKEPPSFGQKCPDQVSCMISHYVIAFCSANPVQHLLPVRSNHLPAAAESVCHPLTWERLRWTFTWFGQIPDPLIMWAILSHPTEGLAWIFSHFSGVYRQVYQVWIQKSSNMNGMNAFCNPG